MKISNMLSMWWRWGNNYVECCWALMIMGSYCLQSEELGRALTTFWGLLEPLRGFSKLWLYRGCTLGRDLWLASALGGSKWDHSARRYDITVWCCCISSVRYEVTSNTHTIAHCVLPVLICGAESWTIPACDTQEARSIAHALSASDLMDSMVRWCFKCWSHCMDSNFHPSLIPLHVVASACLAIWLVWTPCFWHLGFRLNPSHWNPPSLWLEETQVALTGCGFNRLTTPLWHSSTITVHFPGLFHRPHTPCFLKITSTHIKSIFKRIGCLFVSC